MLMDRIKNWLKLLALWAWVHFITLLASDPDSVPKLKYVTEKDEIIILADETTDVDKIKFKKKKKKKSVKDLNEGNEEEPVSKHLDVKLEESNDLDNEEISNEEKVRKSAENESLDKSHLEEEEEKEEKEEEFDIPWLGVGRGTGLTRYSGIQNLLDTNNTAEEPLVIERRQPVLIPRRDGPLVLQRPSFGRSLSHEKERLSEIPEEEKQSPPSFNDDVSNDSDKLWASLVARYGKEEEKDKNNVQNEISGKKDRNTDVEVLQQPIFTSPDESISSEEFSTQVEERLQRYLSKIDEQKLLDERSMEIDNFADETETMDRETEEINEYEVDSGNFDENGRLGNENKILILIEDDDSNEEKEENLDRNYDEVIVPDENFSNENFEINFKEDNKRLKVINEEEEEAVSDYDDIQFDSRSNFITSADTSLATEFQSTGNKDKSSATILDSELMSLATDSSDYIKCEDDYYQYQENVSDEEEIIEEEIPAVFTISLHKKTETLLPFKNDDGTRTLERESVLNRESPIFDQEVLNKTDLSNSEKQVKNVSVADKKVDSSSDFPTNERRQSRDLWKMDCEKMLGEQESPHSQSLEEREDFIFTTYDEFPEDCVPVAEGLLAITEKFGFPLDVETPNDEEEDDSIVDNVFEEPKVPVDNEEFDIFFSEIVPDEESVDKQTDPDFYENLKYNYFIPEIESQEEELKTANLNNDFREASELKTNRITDLPDVTEVEKLATTVEESHSKGISLELKNVNTDQVNVINFVQYDETVAGLDYVNIMTQEAYAMDGNIEVDTLEKEVREVLKSDYEEMETCIEVEPIREKCSFPVMLEKNLSASCVDSFSVTLSEEEQIGKTLGTEMTIDVENATSSEHLLEKVVKEEPVLNIMHHELCDVEMDDSTLETTESVSHFMLEVHAESKLDDSRELETLKESKQVQILEQMKEEKPKEDIDSVTAKYAENKFETKNCDASVAFADKENSNACLENLDAEKFNNDLLKQKMKETLQDKETMYNIPPLNEPVTLSVDISYKQNESLPELPSNEQKKKTVAKVKKGKLDNILKRFEEKEEPVLQKPLPKKRFGVKVKETKPTIEGIENVLVKDHELSAEQKATSSTAISSNKNELADNATQKASKTESLLPTAMDVDKAKACKEETSVFNHNKNNSQTEQAMIKDISEIQSSNDDLNEEIFSSENISEVVQKITVVEKPSEKQSVVVNELATDSSNTHEKEKLKDVILAVSIKEEMCESNKMEVADSLCTTDEENFELASKQADTKGSAPTKTSETKAEVAESVAVDPPSDNIVTVTIPRRKKLQIPKNFEEISEPQKMVKTAVKKGKLNNILNKFEAKECKQIATKALPKLDSNSKAFVIESKDLVVSLNNQHPKEVHDEELKMSSTSVKESSFPAEDGSKEMDIVINEKQASTIAEAADEHMRFDPENVKNLEKPALDSAKDCLLASLESSTVILDNEQDSTVKFKEEIEAAATIISKADTSFIEKELNETFLEIDQSEKSSSEKEFFRFNVKDDKTLLNKIKSTSLLDLGPEIPPEQIIEDDESYYVLDEIQQQQTSLTVEDVDADKEKSYWFDDSKNLREADSLHNRKSANGDEPSYWFEEDSNQQEEDASTFWFEEDAANKIEDEAVPNKGNEDNIYKVETFKSVDTIETKKRHSYFSEDDDDLYFLKKTDTEKPFTEEKDEELALLRKETMELSKPKKIKKDYEDTESARESSFTDNLKSSEISEEDRLEKERILCAIRNEREVSKSGVIPEDEIPDYLDDVKDLLVPKVRRKKGRKSRALDDLMKVEEPDFTSKAMVISKKVSRYEQPLTTEDQANVAAIDAQRARLDPEFASSIVKKDSEPNSNKFLTVEEERELIEIQREQEALRASQRKELEKYLSMPAALTEQEQNELEELLAEQETDRVVNAVSEARLEALLNEVRKRIGDSELDLETAAALEEYIGLPIGLTVEEELLLSNIGEEKDRSQFTSDDEYRDYIKQRYLDELEDERMRVEEDEYEFGGYYEDDYEYDGDEDYDEEYMEEDYDMMEGDNTPLTPTMKDEAIGGDEPMDLETGEGEEGVELKKSKNLLSSLSSLRSKGSKSSSGSLDKPGSNYSSKEGSSSDLQNESSHTQSKKFFRYGGLSIKRKKKIKDYSEIDLGIKNECINTNDVSDNANKDGLSKSIKMLNKNEDSCDCDEAFVIIPKDICKSITNLCANESVEIAHCQDLPKNKIDSSSVISSSLLNEPNSYELLAQKSDHVGKGISNCIDPTLPPLLHPECVLEENDSQDDLNETTPRTSTDMNITHEKCCSSVIDSSLSEKWEVIDSKERACLKPSNCEIPNIFITDASNITTKIFGLLKQKNVQQRNILPLSQIQNTMSIPFNIDVNTKKRAVNLQRDGKRDDSMKPGTVIGASEKYSACEPIESLDNHFSLVNETSHNKDTPSGKSCVIVEAKLKVSKMSEVTSSGPDAMDEEELWPEEGDGKKEDLDEFQKMEQEVEREMEEEQKKKKKPDTDKRGKKKKKRKGESEKENKELSPYLLNSFSSADEVDFDDDVMDEVIKDATRLNGLHSPQFENDNRNRDQLTFVEDDDLANISVKQLTASYLSIAEQSPRKRSPSPNSTPIRPRTPISRLVGTYSSSHAPSPAVHSTTAIQTSTPNGTINHTYPSDFTPGITLKSLKSAYEASAQKRLSPCASPVKDEVHVSFSQLREAYCNVVASHSPREGNSPTPRSTTPLITPNTFRSMTRSCCDIRMACKDYEVPSPPPPAYKVDASLLNVSVKALTRSFSDLTRLGTATTGNGGLKHHFQSPRIDSFGERKVSVKELRKSYEDLPRALIIDVTSDRKLTSPNKHYNQLTATNTRLNCSYTNIQLCANFSGSDRQKIAQAGGPKRQPFTGVSVSNRKTAYQSKDELYEKHVGPRIRSFDAAKMKSKFNKPKEPTQVSNDCRICGKLVFQMEKIVAEKASWHKNCFRCTECNKNLTLETYQSHEGSLYCKPHFKELFRPKAVVQDEAEERKDRLLRRPRMIILESQPELLPDDVVRATEKPDYGLDELQTSLNVKERFAVFESYSKAADEPKLEPVSVRRSQSLMSKAARFSNGHQNGDNEDEEEEYESGEEMEEGEEEGDEEGGEEEDPNHVKSRKKKERPMSFSGMGDLKAVWEQKQRREEMSQARKEDISKFRQMLCAGKNITLKEMFESGNFEGAEDEEKKSREEIKIEDRRSAHNLKARFEKGQPFILEDEEGSEDGSKTSTLVGEKQEVEEVFKDAQTAKQARNVFKQIDSKVAQEGSVILRSPSFAAQNRDNRRSLDISLMMPQRSMSTAEVVKSSQPVEEELQMDTTDLANRFKFFSTFEERQKEETEKKRKVFRITPPREGAEQGLSHGADDSEVLGRDPNLIKCTDNYQDDIDCRNTKNILQMFKKMEMGEEEEEEEEGPRPLKCFTPPPEDGEGDESDYTDEEYSDEGEEEESEEDDDGKPKFKDELLEMEACPQSARKAANLRAKFEKWEERQNELNRDKDNELEEECRPSLDSARNLTAMFEHKAIEVTKPVTSKPVAQKINRFVGGGGEKCMACDKTVYAMEKLEIHGKILHKNCFKCFKCNSRLSMGSFSFGGEQMFCTTHYKQLFTEKGSYDAFLSGKDKWTSKIEATNAEAIKSHD